MCESRLVNSGLKTDEASPTRTIGPSPMGESSKLRDISTQMRRASCGNDPLVQAAIAPTKPDLLGAGQEDAHMTGVRVLAEIIEGRQHRCHAGEVVASRSVEPPVSYPQRAAPKRPTSDDAGANSG